MAQLQATNITGSLTTSGNTTVDTSNDVFAALRITQRGAGHSLLVEDATNPDSSPFVIDNAGNVGIGTSTISSKLNVAGDISVFTGNQIYASTGSATRPAYSFLATEGNNGFFRPSADTIAISTNGVERARITSTGNFGIGTNSPNTKLDVNGDAIITGSLTTTGDLAVNGGDITSTAAILNINAGGTVAVQDNFVITGTLSSSGKIITAGDLSVNGGTLNTTATNFALLASPTTVTFASSATRLDLGTNATDIRIGDQNGTTLILNDLIAASGDSTFYRSGGGSSVIRISGSGVVGSGLIIESGPDDASFINFSSSIGFKISGLGGAGITVVNGGVLEAPWGIRFDVTGEVLNDYEEGTWTPVFSGSTTAGSYVYASQAGRYTKIGNIAYISCIVDITSINTSATGSMRIAGLPFSVANTPSGSEFYMSAVWQGFTTSATNIFAAAADAGSWIDLHIQTLATSTNSFANILSPADVGTGGIRFAGFYRTA